MYSTLRAEVAGAHRAREPIVGVTDHPAVGANLTRAGESHMAPWSDDNSRLPA